MCVTVISSTPEQIVALPLITVHCLLPPAIMEAVRMVSVPLPVSAIQDIPETFAM